jgi:hypothetical protein
MVKMQPQKLVSFLCVFYIKILWRNYELFFNLVIGKVQLVVANCTFQELSIQYKLGIVQIFIITFCFF